MVLNSRLNLPRRLLGRVYGGAETLLTRAILAWRYDAPPETLLPPFSYAEIGVRSEDWWPAGSDRVIYLPSNWGTLKRILRPSDVSPADVFIDMGCGAGRIVLEAAARYPFKRVIGVDIVPQLADLARETIARNEHRLRCRDVEIVTGDMLDYEVPADASVVYLFEPVRGPTLEAVLAKLVGSVDRHQRRMRVIFMGWKEMPTLERTSRARLVRYGRRGLQRWRRAGYLRLYEIEPTPAA